METTIKDFATTIRTVANHPVLHIWSGSIPDHEALQQMSQCYEGVLIIFKDISDELQAE